MENQEIIYTHRTRSGRKARIIGTINSSTYPVVAAILQDDSEHEYCEQLTKDLMVLDCAMESNDDLFAYNPWNDIKVDTPILVSNTQINYVNRHFAKYKDGYFYVWEDGRTSWTTPHMVVFKYAKLPD